MNIKNIKATDKTDYTFKTFKEIISPHYNIKKSKYNYEFNKISFGSYRDELNTKSVDSNKETSKTNSKNKNHNIMKGLGVFAGIFTIACIIKKLTFHTR